MKKKLLVGNIILLIVALTGCQPSPPDESKIMQDLPSELPIYVNWEERIMSDLQLTVNSCTVEEKTAEAYVTYEMTDGTYLFQASCYLYYDYYDRDWILSYSELETSSLTLVSEEIPERVMESLSYWEEEQHFENIKQVECQKIDGNRIDAKYEVSTIEEYSQEKGTISLACRLSLVEDAQLGMVLLPEVPEGLEDSYFMWYREELENTVEETWDVAGTYTGTNTGSLSGWDRVILKIDSFDPDTNELHIAYAKEEWDDSASDAVETYEVSDYIATLKDWNNEGGIQYTVGNTARIELFSYGFCYDDVKLERVS